MSPLCQGEFCKYCEIFFDDHCGTQAEMGDASLGIMGIMRIMRIMGIVGGVMRYPEGLRGRSGEGLTVLPLRQAHEL